MHFTYAKNIDHKQLKQGDILIRTPALVDVLQQYHSYFAKEQYTHFQILTQSCDLVRRHNGPCKSRYITLAAVRSLQDAVTRVLDSITTKVEFNDDLYCSDSQKGKLSEFFRKLFNNNDSDLFFLQYESDCSCLNEPSCTFLHLSIPIKADEHYSTCLDAKRLELSEEFQAKLGWLVGNLYSRVGTKDYVPGAIESEAQFNSLVEETINQYVKLMPSQKFKRFSKLTSQYQSLDQIEEQIEADKKEAREQKIKGLIKLFKKVSPLTAQQEEQLRNAINQEGALKGFLE